MAKRALVTGGAGLIGSHVVDLLVREGWRVRALDNLEPQTHRRGKPAWINEKAEFVEGDLRDRDTITAALGQIDIVKAAVAAFPNIVHVPGPHGIPLIVHAEKGGPAAKAVFEFLQPLAGQPVPR